MKYFEENSEYKNDNSILELIYVVADGEGSELERQLVFSTIANNAELQKEFQNAIKMIKIGELEIQNSTPPIQLTDKLMTNLGFQDVEFLNTYNLSNETPLDIKTTSEFKYNNKIRNSIILFLLLFTSGYVGYILRDYKNIELSNNSQNNIDLIKNQENIINELTEKVDNIIIVNKELKNRINENTNQNLKVNLPVKLFTKRNNNQSKHLVSEFKINNIGNELAEVLNIENQNDLENYSISQVNPIFENDNLLSIDDKLGNNLNKKNINQNHFYNRNIKNLNIRKLNNHLNNSYIAENQIDFFDLVLQFKNSVFKSNNNNSKSINFNENDLTNLENNDWIIQLNTKNDFQFSHDLFSENINNQIRSFELITLYKVDDNLFIGGKIGSEYLPIYYINGENYNLTKNIYHISGNIRYFLPNQKFIIEDLLKPYINFSLGGTSAGLYSGAGVGGYVYIYSNVNLSFGIEFNNLTYFNNNGYFNINKTSTNIGLSYTF